MSKLVYLTPTIAVAGALSADDFAGIAKLGFKAVVGNRPDGEEAGQITARESAVAAWRAGLVYRHVPTTKHEIFEDRVVEQMSDALIDLDGPVLLHCKSGQRSAILWAAAVARSEPVDCVMATLAAAGYEFEALREEIAAQAGRKRTLGHVGKVYCAEAAAA